MHRIKDIEEKRTMEINRKKILNKPEEKIKMYELNKLVHTRSIRKEESIVVEQINPSVNPILFHSYNKTRPKNDDEPKKRGGRRGSLSNDFLVLGDDLLDDLLDNGSLLLSDLELLEGIGREATFETLLAEGGLGSGSPGEPFGELSLAGFDDLLVGGFGFVEILLVELARVVAEVLADQLLLLLGQHGWWAWAPEELLEAVDVLLTEKSSLEVPEMVAVLHLFGMLVKQFLTRVK